MSDRYYVSLTATCSVDALPEVLADMQAAQRNLVDGTGQLDGLSLSFSRDDADDYSAETVSLPDAGSPIMGGASGPLPPSGPVVSTGPGAPPPDAAPATVEQPALPEVNADDGAHAAPEESA